MMPHLEDDMLSSLFLQASELTRGLVRVNDELLGLMEGVPHEEDLGPLVLNEKNDAVGIFVVTVRRARSTGAISSEDGDVDPRTA